MNRTLLKIKNNPTLFLLIFINALGIIAGSLLSPIEAIYISNLTEHKTLVGLTFSLGTICVFCFSILAGRLSHYIRRRKMMIFGLTFGLLYPLIYASALNIFQYMFGRTLWAFTSVSSGVILGVFVQDLLAKKTNIAEISGIKGAVGALSGTFGAILGGYLADNFGFRAPFFGVMLLYTFSLILYVAYVYPQLEKLPPPEKREKGSFSKSIKHIIKEPFLFLRIFLEGITQSHWAMEPIIFPIIIYNLTGKNLATGLVFGLMGVVATLILPMAGRYIDRKSSLHGLRIAFVFYISSFLVLYFANHLYIFALGAMLLSLGKAFNGPAFAKIEVKRIMKEKRIEYMSYFRAYDTLTAALTCLVVGLLLDFVTAKTVILVFLIFTTLGAGVGFLGFNLKTRNNEPEEV